MHLQLFRTKKIFLLIFVDSWRRRKKFQENSKASKVQAGFRDIIDSKTQYYSTSTTSAADQNHIPNPDSIRLSSIHKKSHYGIFLNRHFLGGFLSFFSVSCLCLSLVHTMKLCNCNSIFIPISYFLNFFFLFCCISSWLIHSLLLSFQNSHSLEFLHIIYELSFFKVHVFHIWTWFVEWFRTTAHICPD